MHTPSSYMYSDLRSFGGITNKDAASELLTDRTVCGNGAPRDRINERTFLSRQIVHATPSQEPDSGSFLGGRERVYRRARNLVIDPD